MKTHLRRQPLVLIYMTIMVVAFSVQSCSANNAAPYPAASGIENSPTPVIALEATQPATNQVKSAGTPLPTEVSLVPVGESQSPSEPLRFTFPTAASDPISLWRPPLYPVPWEPTPYDHFYFTRPIGADEINWPLARYRYGGVFWEDNPHTGIDIPARKGADVMAAGPGEVVWAGYGLYFLREEFRDPYGLAVAIKHDFGYQGIALYTVYGHMDKLMAWRGQRVKTGDIIGLVGETGNATGPHLHFEVRLGNNDFFVSRNPELWIAPPQGWGVLAARVLSSNGSPLEKHVLNLRSHASNRYWFVITYGKGAPNSDDYYQENAVLGDLPAGKYTVWIEYGGKILNKVIEIKPGQVTFFTFQGGKGYFMEPPKTPKPVFVTPLPPELVTPNP